MGGVIFTIWIVWFWLGLAYVITRPEERGYWLSNWNCVKTAVAILPLLPVVLPLLALDKIGGGRVKTFNDWLGGKLKRGE